MRAVALLLAASLAGCAVTQTAPRGAVPSASRVSDDPRGAWVRVDAPGGAVAGELLAVEADRVHVLTPQGGVVVVEVGGGVAGRVEAYRGAWGGAAGWAAVGAVSSLTHGFFVSLTGPLWGLAGLVASRPASDEGFFAIPGERTWAEVRAFARFPQGMPPGLDPEALRRSAASGP